jgi:hypothetical protein
MHPALDLDPDFPLPGIVALELVVDRWDETVNFLDESRIAHLELPGGSAVVPASEASGTILFFSDEN